MLPHPTWTRALGTLASLLLVASGLAPLATGQDGPSAPASGVPGPADADRAVDQAARDAGDRVAHELGTRNGTAPEPEMPLDPALLPAPDLSPSRTAVGWTSYRDDDNEMDSSVDIDQGDDYLVKRLPIPAGALEGAYSARIWVYAQAEGCGLTGNTHRLTFNAVTLHEYNPCSKWGTLAYSWASFDLPWTKVVAGATNTIKITDFGSWTERNAFYGIDTDHDYGRSDIQQSNSLFQGQLPGEAMVYIEIYTVWNPPTYTVDFENGQGTWGTTGLWKTTTHRSETGARSMWYGQVQADGSRSYDTGAANSGVLYSPVLDVGGNFPYLSFATWHHTQATNPATRDLMKVEVNPFGTGTWATLYTIDFAMQRWQHPRLDLTAYAGQAITVRFSFDTVDALDNGNEGWSIDNFMLATWGTGSNVLPPVVANMVTVCSTHGVYVSWDESTWRGGSSPAVKVFRGDVDAPSSPASLVTTVADTPGNGGSYTDLPAWRTTPYHYVVTATTSAGESKDSVHRSLAPCDSGLPAFTGAFEPAWQQWSPQMAISGNTVGDAYSGLAATLQYAMGTSPGYTNVVPWTASPQQPTPGDLTWPMDITVDVPTEGDFWVSAKVTDRAGNARTSGSLLHRIRADATPPVGPSAPLALAWSNNPTLNGQCFSDSLSGIDDTVEYRVGTSQMAGDIQDWTLMPSAAQPFPGDTIYNRNWCPSWQPPASALRAGTNHVSLRVHNVAGHVITLPVWVVLYDPVAESVTGLAVKSSNGGAALPLNTWQNDKTPYFEWDAATGSVSPLLGYSHTLGTTATTPDGTVETTGTFVDRASAPLPDGSYTFNVRAVDQAGNQGPVATAALLKVDATVPGLPSVSSSTHGDGLWHSRDQMAVAWSASDALSGIDGFLLRAPSLADCPAPAANTAMAGGTWVEQTTLSASYPGLGPFGAYKFCVQAKDNAGNYGAVRTFVGNIDLYAPAVTSKAPSPTAGGLPTAVFRVDYNDKDGGADPAQATKVDVGTVSLVIDGTDIRAAYASTCPPTGTICRLVVTQDYIEFKPPSPWTLGDHTATLTMKDTTVERNTFAEWWTFNIHV